MGINTMLSVNRCWDMVNRIQDGKSPEDIRRRCNIAVEWLRANKVISNDEYNDLMMAVSFLYRESYR